MHRNTTVALVALLVVGAGVVGLLVGNSFGSGDADPTVLGTDEGPGSTDDGPGGTDGGIDGLDGTDRDPGGTDGPGDRDGGDASEVKTFDGPEEFESYVQNSRRSAGGFGVARGVGGAEMVEPAVEREFDMAVRADAAGDAAQSGGDGGDGGGGEVSAPRVGTTNVQERGIDEPDVVKTDGQHFYVSQRHPVAVRDAVDEDDEKRRFPGRTHVVDVSEPADPQRIAGINTSGRMLVVGDTLVVLQHDRVVGFDVSTPNDPTREWSRALNGSVVSARATGGQVYLVVASELGPSPTCPVEPLADATVACDDIYRPTSQVPVDATYTALSLAPANGSVTDSVGFVGTRRGSTVYMFDDALYVTYTDPMDRTAVTVDALLASDAVPSDVKDRMREVRSYNLSARATEVELSYTMQNWFRSLPDSERKATRKAVTEDVKSYVATHQRELTTTGVVRVDVGDGGSLAVAAQGSVPGRPLNQFSMDQYNGTLRIATTVPALRGNSTNDLYTLNATTLERTGAVQGMADGQRIFAVRYVEERAYVVTFRRVDPFHVIDLSDPSDPVELGVKKLPGFSRYLHPIDENHVLGIGEEDGHVKAVLFNVSDPANPTIADSKIYTQHWSAVSQTHHAFTIDRRHGVFFLPAGEQGLVVDYTNETLSTRTTVEAEGVRRARYVGDYLYVFGQREIVVVDETDWSVETRLELANER